MKVFIVGMPQSGRTTVAKALSQLNGYCYVDAASWIRSSFREKKDKELQQHYQDEYHSWLLKRLKNTPNMIVDNVNNSISSYIEGENFIIDGIFSPQDFVSLFDFKKDIVVFLNRTNNQSEYKDYENIGVSVLRDYCFWLSSAELLDKDNWYEYNFNIPGTASNEVKTLGHKNSVFIVKSIAGVINHLQNRLVNLRAPQS